MRLGPTEPLSLKLKLPEFFFWGGGGGGESPPGDRTLGGVLNSDLLADSILTNFRCT